MVLHSFWRWDLFFLPFFVIFLFSFKKSRRHLLPLHYYYYYYYYHYYIKADSANGRLRGCQQPTSSRELIGKGWWRHNARRMTSFVQKILFDSDRHELAMTLVSLASQPFLVLSLDASPWGGAFDTSLGPGSALGEKWEKNRRTKLAERQSGEREKVLSAYIPTAEPRPRPRW